MYLKELVVIGVVALLSACGGSENQGTVIAAVTDGAVVAPAALTNGCPSIEGTGVTGIEGIYDITNYATSPVNVLYTSIGRDGIATDFDFDNDEFGSGLNCFVKGQEGFASFTRISGDRYSWTFGNPFNDTGCAYARDEVIIETSADILTISNTSGATIDWRIVSDANLSDLTTCP